MKAGEIREFPLETTCDVATDQVAPMVHDCAQMIRECAAQLAEANESLKCIAHPLLYFETGKIDPETFKDAQPGKITFRPSQDAKTLRDEIAIAALTGMLADPQVQVGGSNDAQTVKLCYAIADAMLEARKK